MYVKKEVVKIMRINDLGQVIKSFQKKEDYFAKFSPLL